MAAGIAAQNSIVGRGVTDMMKQGKGGQGGMEEQPAMMPQQAYAPNPFLTQQLAQLQGMRGLRFDPAQMLGAGMYSGMQPVRFAGAPIEDKKKRVGLMNANDGNYGNDLQS